MPAKPSKSKIISVSLPQALARAVSRATSHSGSSRSKLIQDALEQYLWLNEWQDVQAYGVARAAALDLVPEDVDRLIKEYRREKKKNPRRR